jgi:hypothetical protein
MLYSDRLNMIFLLSHPESVATKSKGNYDCQILILSHQAEGHSKSHINYLYLEKISFK